MDSKFYVSLKAAKLLKEKGFNEECGMSYNEKGEMLLPWDSLQETRYSAPTKAEAIDWLESKGIVVGIAYQRCFDRYYFGLDYKNGELLPYPAQYELFLTRLEAEEAAIIKALELL